MHPMKLTIIVFVSHHASLFTHHALQQYHNHKSCWPSFKHTIYNSFNMRTAVMYSTPEMNLFTAAGRLMTFTEDWKLTDGLSPSEMSKAGLFRCPIDVFTRENKKCVTCAYCDICITGWEDGDTALGEHRRLSSRCPFINKFPKGTTDPAERSLIYTRPKPKNCCCWKNAIPYSSNHVVVNP
jgi:hypothetical protein